MEAKMAGLVSEAAVPKGNRAPESPSVQPMRPVRQGEVRRNPSTDQKKVRRQISTGQQKTADDRFGTLPAADPWGDVGREFGQCKACQGQGRDYHNRPCAACGGSGETRTASLHTATQYDTWAERLNPGDQIRLPNGKTQKVLRVRRHETDAQRRYVDTDGGTALVHRQDSFQVVPHNSQQQSTPGYGRPGANSNSLPFGGHGGQGGSNVKSSTQCPSCGANGTLQQRGDHYQCTRCGYQEQFGGAGNHSYTDRESIVQGRAPGRKNTNPFLSTINRPMQSAIARRAQEVLEQEEQS